MQRDPFIRLGAAQLQLQQVREQPVVAEPRPARVQRGHERAGLLQILQDPFPARPPGQHVRQRAGHPLQHGRAQQQQPRLLALPVQHLGQQVLGHRPIGAGELRGEPLRVRVLGQRQRGQPQPSDPALSPSVQPGQHLVRQLHPGSAEQRSRLSQAEPQIGRTDIGQLPVQPQPVQPQPQVMPGREDEPQLWRRARHQELQLGQHLIRAQQMRIVDHQPQPVFQRGQILQQPLHHRPAVQIRRRGQRPHQHRSGRCTPQRVGYRDPEPSRITLLAVHRYPRGVPAQASLGDPGPHQHRLPAPSRRRYLNDTFRFGQAAEQRAARHHSSPDGRNGRARG